MLLVEISFSSQNKHYYLFQVGFCFVGSYFMWLRISLGQLSVRSKKIEMHVCMYEASGDFSKPLGTSYTQPYTRMHILIIFPEDIGDRFHKDHMKRGLQKAVGALHREGALYTYIHIYTF